MLLITSINRYVSGYLQYLTRVFNFKPFEDLTPSHVNTFNMLISNTVQAANPKFHLVWGINEIFL